MEEQDASVASWPLRTYACTFCKRGFTSAQALGGHMNVHRRDRALLRQCSTAASSATSSSSTAPAGQHPEESKPRRTDSPVVYQGIVAPPSAPGSVPLSHNVVNVNSSLIPRFSGTVSFERNWDVQQDQQQTRHRQPYPSGHHRSHYNIASSISGYDDPTTTASGPAEDHEHDLDLELRLGEKP